MVTTHSPATSAPAAFGQARLIPVDRVVVKKRLRPRQEQAISNIARSLQAEGLLHPIIVRPSIHGFELISGHHRLEAARRIGWTNIPAVVKEIDDAEAQLIEIDENLMRANLSVLEEAEHLRLRKVIYEDRHPETARPKGGRRTQTSATVASFTDDTAAQIKQSKRAIQQRLQIAAGLSQEARDTIRGTPTAHRTRQLVDLARVKDPALQLDIAKMLVADEARSVAAAIGKIEPPVATHDTSAANDTTPASDSPTGDRSDVLRFALVFDWDKARVNADYRWIYPFLEWWLNPQLTKIELMERVKSTWKGYWSPFLFEPMDVFLDSLPKPLREIAPGYVPEEFTASFTEAFSNRFSQIRVDPATIEYVWHYVGDDPALADDLLVIVESEYLRMPGTWPLTALVEHVNEAQEKGRDVIRQQAQRVREGGLA